MTEGRYVDDIFGGADSPSEARDIIQQLTRLCDAGGFPLQKWSSNCPELLPKSNEGRPTDVEIDPTLCKILGLVWRPCSDTLHFSSTISGTVTFTKRAIASDIAKLYDPLGLISPILIRAKTILQDL
ncbi:Gag-pol protein [Camponotus japonicus]